MVEAKDESVALSFAAAAAAAADVSEGSSSEEEEEEEQEEEFYSLLFEDQTSSLEEDIDYAKVDRERIESEERRYDQYTYYSETMVDEDGVEVGWDPVFGPSNPIDDRAILSDIESYMVADATRDDRLLTPMALADEDAFQQEVRAIRLNRNRLETYEDPYLHVEVPRHARPWYGERDMDQNPYEPKDYMNNRYTRAEDKTDFTKLTPFEARKRAVFMARSKNNEWLPDGYSQERKAEDTRLFRERKILAGSLLQGEIDETKLEQLQPILRKIGGVATVLSIEEGVFRFHYKGPMKHRRGIRNWTEMLMTELDIDFTGVFFETGVRKVDPRDTVFKGFECYGRAE